MSRIIVSVRYAKPKKDFFKKEKEEDDGLDAHTRRIIGKIDYEEENLNPEETFKEMFSEENLEIYYKPYCIKTEDIHDFSPLDEEHTIVVSEYSGILPVHMKWNEWILMWEKRTGEAVFIEGELASFENPTKKKK